MVAPDQARPDWLCCVQQNVCLPFESPILWTSGSKEGGSARRRPIAAGSEGSAPPQASLVARNSIKARTLGRTNFLLG